MAFTNNTTYGTTAYSTGTFYDQSIIVANDGSDLSSNTLATQSALTIKLGGYERVIGKYVLWYDSDNTNELKFIVRTVAQSDGTTAVASTIYTQAIASVLESTSAATAASAKLESTGTSNTNGAGVEVEIDIGAATTGTGAGSHFLAGSHVMYKKC